MLVTAVLWITCPQQILCLQSALGTVTSSLAPLSRCLERVSNSAIAGGRVELPAAHRPPARLGRHGAAEDCGSNHPPRSRAASADPATLLNGLAFADGAVCTSDGPAPVQFVCPADLRRRQTLPTAVGRKDPASILARTLAIDPGSFGGRRSTDALERG